MPEAEVESMTTIDYHAIVIAFAVQKHLES